MKISLVHPDAVDPNSKNYTSRDLLNHYYFLPGHFVVVRYTPLQFYKVYKPNENTTRLEHFISFLGFMKKVPDFSYQSTVEHIPFPKGWYNNMTTVIVLRPQSTIEVITYQDEKKSFKDTMAKIGGLMGFVSSVLVFLFGASLLSPWGFIAGIPCFRRRIINSLAEAYYSPDSSGPFTIKSNNIGRFDSRHTSVWRMIKLLKQRVDELELVLSDYFVDTSVFQHFPKVRRKVKRLKTRQTLAIANRTQGNSQHQCPTSSLTQPCQTLPGSYDHHSHYRFHISRPPTKPNPLCRRNTSSATHTISVLEQSHQLQDLPQQEYVQQLQHSSTPSPSHAISQCSARPSWRRNSGVSGAGVGYVFVPMSEDCDMSHISDLCKES
ncbi:hypothetical protein BGZ81_010788 [Podila clonocystis]|nr:hypothetical protein BGZ81_010788 [Podila clonocystis]